MESSPVILYGRPGCELCARAELIVRELIAAQDAHLTLTVIDIEADPTLHARFFEQIPVLEVAGLLLPLAVSPMQIAAHLRAAQGQGDGER